MRNTVMENVYCTLVYSYMNNYKPEVTAYIEKSDSFAQPILTHIRELIHKTCPDVEEQMRWGHPHYYYKGKGMCFNQALKGRVTFGFWYDSLVFDPAKLSAAAIKAQESMGFMKDIKEIPSDEIFVECIKIGMEVKEQGLKVETKSKPKAELVVPDYFTKALEKNSVAKKNFEVMSPSHKREYVNWIIDAKTEETREKRIAQAIEQIAEKKSKNWKYQ